MIVSEEEAVVVVAAAVLWADRATLSDGVGASTAALETAVYALSMESSSAVAPRASAEASISFFWDFLLRVGMATDGFTYSGGTVSEGAFFL